MLVAVISVMKKKRLPISFNATLSCFYSCTEKTNIDAKGRAEPLDAVLNCFAQNRA
jgi:hypothetical protein